MFYFHAQNENLKFAYVIRRLKALTVDFNISSSEQMILINKLTQMFHISDETPDPEKS